MHRSLFTLLASVVLLATPPGAAGAELTSAGLGGPDGSVADLTPAGLGVPDGSVAELVAMGSSSRLTPAGDSAEGQVCSDPASDELRLAALSAGDDPLGATRGDSTTGGSPSEESHLAAVSASAALLARPSEPSTADTGRQTDEAANLEALGSSASGQATARVVFERRGPVYLSAGPSEPIAVPPGEVVVIPLDKGIHAGLRVVASEGLATPRCSVILASAVAQVAAGTPLVSIELGHPDGPWRDVATSPFAVPMTVAVPTPADRGSTMRLVVSNPTAHPIVLWPEGTRLSLYGAACA